MRLNWIGTVAFALILSSTSLASRPEPNAFLDEPVSSTGQLVKQVQTDTAVRDRYLRHFGMSESELSAYLWSLSLTRMQNSETLAVYSVPGSGAVKVHQQVIKKGERVFVDSSGTPALLARCGNPLTQGPSNRINMAVMLPTLRDNEALVAQTLPIGDTNPIMLDVPRPTIAMAEPPDTVADVVVEPETVTTSIVPTPPATTVVVTPVPPVLASAGGGRGLGGLLILPLLAGAIWLGSNHGGGGTPVVPPPTPEPAGIVLLGFAGGSLILRRRIRR